MLRKKWLFITIIIGFCYQMNYGQEYQLMHDGIMRTYVVYEPNLEPNPEGYPLVIGLHGTGSNGYQFIATAGLVLKANNEKFIVACPDALFYGTFTYFNAGGGFEEMTNGTDDLGFISELIDTMVVNYNVDTTRIYVMGFSNGSAMSYRVAAELSYKIAAIGAVSGQMVYEYCNPEFPVPIMHFHGLSDTFIPYEGNDENIPSVESVMEIWRLINDCYSIPYTIYNEPGIISKKWPSFDGKNDVILYTIQDQEHEWPRPATLDISATDVIWDFLKLHRRVSVTNSKEWYVSPDGTYRGNGSSKNPWDLRTAFSQRLIQPGDTVWLKGGTYTGPFVKEKSPAGTKYAPIIYRAMPGQRVTLKTDNPNEPILMNEADYVWFWGMEVTGKYLEQTVQNPVSGIEQDSVYGTKYINMVVHDCPGSGFDAGSIGTELTGCLSYNNRNSGFSGLNGPNDVNDSTENLPWLRYFDCIAFDNFESGFMHDSDSQQLANILHRGCVAYGNSRATEWAEDAYNFRLGGHQFDDNFVMQDCFAYFPPDPNTQATALWGSILSPMDGRVTIENNIFVGGGKGVAIDGWDRVIFQCNTCYTVLGDLLDIGATGDPNNCTIDDNTYYQSSEQFLYMQGTHYDSLAAWQVATGWDPNSTQIAGRPQTPWIHLRLNKYDPDSAHLVIYNWPGTDTVTVNMADLWPEEGQQYQYRIVSVEDIWGEPAVEGTLIDGAIEVPMQGKYTLEFACYLVTRKPEE